jgi:hypothetical protein
MEIPPEDKIGWVRATQGNLVDFLQQIILAVIINISRLRRRTSAAIPLGDLWFWNQGLW